MKISLTSLKNHPKTDCSLIYCVFIDVTKKIAPDFITPAPPNFSSSITFEKDFPFCDQNKLRYLSSRKERFVPEGTKVAWWSMAAAAGIGAVIGCLLFINDEVSGPGEAALPPPLVTIPVGGIPAAIKGGPFLSLGALGGIFGAAGGYLGYVTCEKVTYLIESGD